MLGAAGYTPARRRHFEHVTTRALATCAVLDRLNRAPHTAVFGLPKNVVVATMWIVLAMSLPFVWTGFGPRSLCAVGDSNPTQPAGWRHLAQRNLSTAVGAVRP